MRYPIRLRAWHSGIIEDADGQTVATCDSVPDAEALITAANSALLTAADKAHAFVTAIADGAPREIEAMQDAFANIRADFTRGAAARHVATYLYDAFARGKFSR